MPLKNGHLTAKERVFVGHMARTGDAVYAATKAGYSSPENRGPEKARTLRAATRQKFSDLVVTELLPKAYEAIRRTLESPTTPAGAVNTAAKLVFDHAFGDDPEMSDLDPSEMTMDQILRKQAALQREREERAKDITPEQVSTTDPTSVFD